MNDSEKCFKIKNLGTMKFVLPIIDFDYPRTFVCKKEDSQNLVLYLFDEFDHDNNSLSWLCVQTSIDEIDRLNRGLITLESCFRGPRFTKKPGYIIKSFTGSDIADCELLNDISKFVEGRNTFVDEFISDENEGVHLLSAIYEKPFVATVLKPEKYADPLIDSSRISKGSELFKSMINSLPFMVETKNCCCSQTRSLVVYYEISDKKPFNNKQLLLSDEFINNEETHCAFNAIGTILNPDAKEADIINAFKGDKNSIKKASNFINEIKMNAKNCPVEIYAFDYLADKNSVAIVSKIDKKTSQLVKEKSAEIIKIIDSTENHITDELIEVGQFLMLDTTGRKKFKFQTAKFNGETKIYSGFSKCDVSGITVDERGKTKYKVKILSDVLRGEFGRSNPVYSLIEIVEALGTEEQASIFEDK